MRREMAARRRGRSRARQFTWSPPCRANREHETGDDDGLGDGDGDMLGDGLGDGDAIGGGGFIVDPPPPPPHAATNAAIDTTKTSDRATYIRRPNGVADPIFIFELRREGQNPVLIISDGRALRPHFVETSVSGRFGGRGSHGKSHGSRGRRASAYGCAARRHRRGLERPGVS